jgi:probable HAF family extracellular repeat protein
MEAAMRSLQSFAYYLVLALTFTSGAEAQRYKVTTLPSLPKGNGVVADSINKLGSITGFGYIGPHLYAIRYRKGRLRNLGTLPGKTDSYGTGINVLGQVTGTATITGGPDRAFLYGDGSMSDIGLLPGDTSATETALIIPAK